ncbi:MAG: hypothetical protein JOZ31_26040 [Verrucomicrobia bacterium]|nr:hypothetical protein [Verrucomicrobiota bacterium]MBV8485589.1 hypothetical protein [Verrucomicrobiota bacterium]
MTNFVGRSPQGSQGSVQKRHGVLKKRPDEPEKDSYEWYLVRCQNLALFHLIEVGESMREIRDRELYRTEYPTWADFCREKLSISVRQAESRIHCAAIVSELLEADCAHLPFKESQCRPLLRLEQGFLRVYAWELACGLAPVGKTPTGSDVLRAVLLLELWRPPINEAKRSYFDFRKLLYGSRISIKLAEAIFNSSRFQHWVEKDASNIELRLLRTLVEDLVHRLNSIKVSEGPGIPINGILHEREKR